MWIWTVSILVAWFVVAFLLALALGRRLREVDGTTVRVVPRSPVKPVAAVAVVAVVLD